LLELFEVEFVEASLVFSEASLVFSEASLVFSEASLCCFLVEKLHTNLKRPKSALKPHNQEDFFGFSEP